MKYIFNVTDNSKEQRPYADRVDDYIIKNECEQCWAPVLIERFCTKFLKPCRLKEGSDSKFASMRPYYKFEQIDSRTFRYTVISPYLG